MIKKLSLKFVLVFLVLVVSVIITSSCYAVMDTTVLTSPFTKEDIYSGSNFQTVCTEEGLSLNENNSKIIALKDNSRTNERNYYVYVLYSNYSDISYIGFSDDGVYGNFYDKDGNIITANYLCGYVFETGLFSTTSSISNSSGSRLSVVATNSGHSFSILDITDFTVKMADEVFYNTSVDTSFNYSFEGVKRGQVKLTINNLDTSLKMYGYVDCENNFNVGDTLDTSSISNYLRLLAMYSDNSDLNCYLYDGEELLYYIVDENNIILDIGYISEMAKGNFLYGFNVYNGVDFVYLKDGQVYWDNNLTFKYSVGSSSEYEKNDIVSMGESSYIVTDKTVASNTYRGYVYDVDGTLIAEASANSSNDLSSISISVDTNYYETNVGWNKSCYWLMSFELDGTNVDGSFIDFSNYYAKWSIPTWVNLNSIEVNGEEYTKRNGIFNGFSSAGYSGMVNLKIYELIKNHISNFDIKLEIYDSEDNLVLTYIVNSDDIVKEQISSEENNVDKGDYDILDNPNYTGGSNSNYGDINNIQNWTADDYLNLMSTDNFVWEFFKAILGNLPWWITTPLTILIFGVVIITIIRFARGA